MRKNILLIIVLTCLVKNNVTAQEWSALGSGMSVTGCYGCESAIITTLAEYNGELYAGGHFDTAGGIPAKNIARWNGTNWSALGSGVNGQNGRVNAMAVYNGELYVAGQLTTAGGIPVNNIAKWNGTNWSTVGSGLNLTVRDLIVYMAELYVGGSFDSAGGIAANRIAKWNGTNWSTVGSGIGLYSTEPPYSFVASFAIHNQNLYAGGHFTSAGGVTANSIACWNGTNWSGVGQGVNQNVLAMESFGGTLYAAGSFWTTGNQSLNNIAKWDGSNWLSVGQGLNDAVYCLAIYNNSLYAGGVFAWNDNAPLNGIAKLDGTNWLPVGHGTDFTFAFASTDSALYVGGHFYNANEDFYFCDNSASINYNHIAKWTDNCSVSPPQPCNIFGDTIVCPNSTQTYSTSPITNATSYEWLLPTGWTGNSSSNTITVSAGTNGGIISVIAMNSCGSSIPQTLEVATGQVAPSSPDYINGDYYVCRNSVRTYWISPVNGATSYTWNLPSGWTGSSTTNSITTTVGTIDGPITVTANNSCGNSYPQEIWVEINTIPTQPSAIIGNNDVCVGTTQVFSINPVDMASDYTWILPPGWSGTSNSNSITVQTGSNSGSISVVANNSCGSSIPQTILITTESIPAMPAMINGNDTVCEGSAQTYFIDPVPGATGYAWDLTFGTAFGFDSTIITITPLHSGYPDDFITVSAYNNCGSSDMLTLLVKVNHLPYQPNRIFGSDLVCRGSNQIYFIDIVHGATSYTWVIPSGWIGNSNTSSINIDVGNETGDISVRANNSCGSGAFASLQVLPDTVPAQPRIINGNAYVATGEKHGYSVDITSRPLSYNWSLSGGGNLTPGQSPQKIEIDWQTPGTYVLSVNAVNSCGISSDKKLTITVSASNEKDPYSLQLFPNPSTGEFYLKAKRVQDKWISVEVLSMSGQSMYRSERVLGSNDYTLLIDQDKMATGLYVVKIIVNDKAFTKKIAIIR